MAFVKIDKSPRGLYLAGEVMVRMGSHNQGAKGTSRGIYFSITEEVVKQAGWNVIESDDGKRKHVLLDMQEGVGEDAGFLLLVASPDGKGYSVGTTTDHARSYSVSISLSKLRHYVLNEVPVPSHDVEFTIDEKEHTLLIQCPDWMRYNPLSYDEPKKVAASPPTKAAAPVAREDAKAKPVPINRKDRRAQVTAATRSLQ